MDNSVLNKQIIDLLESEIETEVGSRFYNPLDWSTYTAEVIDCWKTTFDDYATNGNCDMSFEEAFLDTLTIKLEDDGIIERFDDIARQIVRNNTSTLYDNDDLSAELAEYIASCSVDDITEIVADALGEKDKQTAKDSYNLKHVNFRMLYIPDFVGVEDETIYISSLSEIKVDESVAKALAFFQVSGKALDDEFIAAGYESNEDLAALPTNENMDGKVISPRMLRIIFENAYKFNLPSVFFAVDFSTLCKLAPGASLRVSGGSIGLVDYINGSGHVESIEDEHFVTFELTTAGVFECQNSEKGKFIDKIYGPTFEFFRSENTVL